MGITPEMEGALRELETIEGEGVLHAIHEELGGIDIFGFPTGPRDPEEPHFPEGWTLLSGVDSMVAEGFGEDESERAILGSPWLFQPDGSPRLGDVPPRGYMGFPATTTYGEAFIALVQSVSLIGRVPDIASARRLAQPPFSVAITAIGVYVAAEAHSAPLSDPVWALDAGARWLNLTAPAGVEGDDDWVLAPAISFPECLDDDDIDRLLEHARMVNIPIPLVGAITTGMDDSEHEAI